MAEDVAPVLLEKIKKAFEDGIEQNEAIKKLEKKLDDGGWGFLEAEHYALEVGKELSGAFLDNLSSNVLPNGRMYYNIAERIIPPMMYEEYDLATDAALQVVKNLNDKAGVRVAPQRPLIDDDRVRGIVDKVSDAEYFDDAKWLLKDPVQNFAVHCVDKTVEQNALFQHRAGLRPRIKRDSGGKCCDWCAALDGMYEYPGVPRDIFMRHENCNCTVEYLPGDGRAQNVYSKEYRDLDAVEERKAFSERAADPNEARERILKAEAEKERLSPLVKQEYSSKDVTAEYNLNALTHRGSVSVEDANGKYPGEQELKMRDWLNNQFGGSITALKEPGDVLSPDYLWSGKLWDLKSLETLKYNTVDQRIRHGLKQITESNRPYSAGGLILDYTMSGLSMEQAIAYSLQSSISRAKISFDVIVKKGEYYHIFRISNNQ